MTGPWAHHHCSWNSGPVKSGGVCGRNEAAGLAARHTHGVNGSIQLRRAGRRPRGGLAQEQAAAQGIPVTLLGCPGTLHACCPPWCGSSPLGVSLRAIRCCLPGFARVDPSVSTGVGGRPARIRGLGYFGCTAARGWRTQPVVAGWPCLIDRRNIYGPRPTSGR